MISFNFLFIKMYFSLYLNKFSTASFFHGGVVGTCVAGFLTSLPSVHHGPRVAQPVHLDSTQLSKKFISDYLWSLVDTEW